ncbi:MAG: hypothetical protein M0R74_02690 [Dehalococcoidia bacterium]|nr:hypothetical protein [Dehalococcoidia bacterium]
MTMRRERSQDENTGRTTPSSSTARRRALRGPSVRPESVTLPVVGQRVYSTSGRQLGVVAQVRPDCFHVAMEEDDVWLSREAIFTVQDGSVTLICEPERIVAYTVNPMPRRNGFR